MTQIFSETRQKHMKKKKMSSQYRELESLQTHNPSPLYTYKLCTYVCNSSLLFPAFFSFHFPFESPY